MHIPRRSVLVAVPCLFAGCLALPRAGASEMLLVSQPAAPNPSRVGLGFYSSSHPRPTRNFKRADDFRLDDAYRITRVRWWGLSEGRVFTDLRNFDQYTIEVYEGIDSPSGPMPGGLLWREEFSPAALSIVPTGRASPSTGAVEYTFEAALTTTLQLGATQPFLLAVSARSVNPSGDAWQWQDARFFGGHGAIFSYASGAWSPFQDTDSAFEILGVPLPAPGTALVLGGAALLSGRRRAEPARTPRV